MSIQQATKTYQVVVIAVAPAYRYIEVEAESEEAAMALVDPEKLTLSRGDWQIDSGCEVWDREVADAYPVDA
jgi:hypothetical protein